MGRSVVRSFQSSRIIPLNCQSSEKLAENHGLGYALSVGMMHCKGELVARMDSDDICISTRFARQVEFLGMHPEVDVVGSAIAEFADDSTKVLAKRNLPDESEQLSRFARTRNPLNHMTVVFRKEAVLQAGELSDRAGIRRLSPLGTHADEGPAFTTFPRHSSLPVAATECKSGGAGSPICDRRFGFSIT